MNDTHYILGSPFVGVINILSLIKVEGKPEGELR